MRRPQPSPAARGYGVAHRRLRAKLKPTVDAGRATCARCRQPITPGEPWGLGHSDHPQAKARGLYSGPEHRNRSRAKRPRANPPQPAAKALAFFTATNKRTKTPGSKHNEGP